MPDRRARRAPPTVPSTSTPSGGRTTPSRTGSTTSSAGRACRSTWGWPTWSGSATCCASTTCTTPRDSRPSTGSRRRSGTRSSTTQRTVDGSWNDLDNPTMGMAGTRFGRNVPIEHTWPDTANLLEPNPRTVSRRLMTRDELIPATAGNALIAAWLQFMIRDWFKHGPSPTEDPWVLELDPDDDWPSPPLLVHRTPGDPTTPAEKNDLPPTFLNVNTHWWDGSQIYGNSAGGAGVPARARGRPAAAGRRPSPAARRPGAQPRADPGLLGGRRDDADPVRARAQRVCDDAREGLPRLGRRAALPAGAGDHGRAARQDPHRRVDAGRDRAPDGGRGPARQLVRPGRPEARPASSAGSSRTRSSPASPAPRPTTTACRSR